MKYRILNPRRIESLGRPLPPFARLHEKHYWLKKIRTRFDFSAMWNIGEGSIGDQG
jgi:hypothetical protein